MAQARTARGTNSSKASGTSLSVNNVSMDAGATIIVGICFETSQGNPTIKWGNKLLRRDITIEHTGASIRTQIYRGFARNAKTLDVVATWDAAILARAMFVTQLTEANEEDVKKDKAETATTDPDTGVAPTSTAANTVSIAAFGSNGPVEDTIGTVGSGHTSGQRDGTTGGVATTNVTIHETYEFLTAISTIKSQKTGATSRDWASCVVAYKGRTFTIKDCRQDHRDMNQEPDWVVTVVEDSANDGFTFNIDPETFDAMSDTEYKDAVKAACSAWSARKLEDESIVDEDSTRDTRMAGFVNDEVTV